jgi:hypothetical protein
MKDQDDKMYEYAGWLAKYGGYANGMTLRDHFAGLAMQSLIQTSTGDDNEIVDAAEDAYSYADAMLKARNE